MGTKSMHLGGKHKYRLPGTKLSPRQLQVLGLIAQGLTDMEIGFKLHISYQTVKYHGAEMRYRLGAKNRVHAVMIGIKEGLI